MAQMCFFRKTLSICCIFIYCTMDALDVVDFLEDVVFPSTIAIAIIIALIVRFRRLNFQRKIQFNKIFAMQPIANQLIVQVETPTILSVWTIGKKKLFKTVRIGNKWYIQDASNKQNLVTMKNGYLEKFIILSNTKKNIHSPFNTSPSILKVEQGWFRSNMDNVGVESKTDFSFGNKNMIMRWVGLNHLEFIYKENDQYIGSSDVSVHQRVALSKEYSDGYLRSYILFFNYDRINIEVLVSTFLFSLILQKSPYRGVVKKPPKKGIFSRIKDYLKSSIIP